MNRKVLRNKSFLMSNTFNRKKMYKSSKQWMVASALVLALLGGGAVAGHASAVHADNANAHVQQPSNPSQKPATDKSSLNQQTSSAASQANILKAEIKNHTAVQSAQSANSASASQSSSAESVSQGSSVSASSSASSSAKPMMLGERPNYGLGDPTPANQISNEVVLETSAGAVASAINVTGTSSETFNVESSSSSSVDYLNLVSGKTVESYAMPTNYQLAGAGQQITLSSDNNISNQPDHITVAYQPCTSDSTTNNSDIPVVGNSDVHFKGNVILNFKDSKNNLIHRVEIPYNVKETAENDTGDFLPENNGNPRIPSNYVNHILEEYGNNSDDLHKKYNTKNYTYVDDNGITNLSYSGVLVDPNNTSKYDATTNTYNNGDLNLDFKALPTNESIYYQYTNSNGSTFNENSGGSAHAQVITGDNDTSGSINSSVANSASASGALKPGWDLVNSNTSFIYGNGGSDANNSDNDKITVPVTPSSASATIEYVVSDNNATNNGSSIASSTFSGNDYRATDAGNNNYVINSSTATNANKSGNGSNGLPAGYHIVVSDGHGNDVPFSKNTHINVPYDNNSNGKHIIKIQGNMQNPNGRDTDPKKAITKDPSTLPKTDPNYVPASDVVAIHSVEYRAGDNTPVGTVTKYMAVSGRTGEQNTYNPNDFQPAGYSTDSNDKSQSVTIQPNGVTPNSVTFAYNAQSEDNITVAIQYKNNKGVEHTLARHDITGPTSQQGDIYTYKDGKNNNAEDLAIPQGYHFVNAFGGAQGQTPEPSSVNGTSFPYTITADAQDIIINVAGNTVTPKKAVTPNKPTTPSDNPVNPANPSDVPSGKTNIPAKSSDASDTFYVTIKDWDGKRLVRTYQKRMTESGNIGDQFTINPNTYITNGYSKTNSDNTYNGYIGANQNGKVILLSSDDKTPTNNVTWNYDANSQNATITYIDQAGNTETKQITGHTDSDINVTKPSDGGHSLPSGYHTDGNTNYNFHFNGPLDNPSNPDNNGKGTTYLIQGNSISGNAHITLKYNGISTTTHSDNVPIKGQVGDKPEVITPWNIKYLKPNYKVDSSVRKFDFTSKTVPKDNSTYNPNITFNYDGTPAEIYITYVDVTPGAQPSPEYNKQMVTFKGKQYPIVGHQPLHDAGLVGQVVDLTAKELQVPAGFTLKGTDNYRLLVKKNKVLGSIFLGAPRVNHLMLLGEPMNINNHKKSANASSSNVPSKPASATSSKASNSAVVPSTKSSASNTSANSSANSVSSSESSAVPSSESSQLVIVDPAISASSLALSSASSNASASSSVASASSASDDEDTEHNSDIPVLQKNTAKPSHKSASDDIIKPRSPKNAVTPANAKPSTSKVVNNERTEAQAPVFSNVPSDNKALANNTVVTPNNSTAAGKLPQTSESSNYAGIMALVALLLGVGLADVDLKHRYE